MVNPIQQRFVNTFSGMGSSTLHSRAPGQQRAFHWQSAIRASGGAGAATPPCPGLRPHSLWKSGPEAQAHAAAGSQLLCGPAPRLGRARRGQPVPRASPRPSPHAPSQAVAGRNHGRQAGPSSAVFRS